MGRRLFAPKPFGVNVVGYLSGNMGISIAARSTVTALLSADVPVAVVDMKVWHGIPRVAQPDRDWEFADLDVGSRRRLPHPITLVHMNPKGGQVVRVMHPRWFADTYTCSVPFWELPGLQRRWRSLLSSYDAVLAPTTFIHAAVSSAVRTPVALFPLAVDEPVVEPVARSDFGIPSGRPVFVASWDPGGGTQRKNGLGLLTAFRRALALGADATLVIKLAGKEEPPELADAIARDSDDRIVVIRDYLPYGRLLGLYAACDVYVSLHRAEGLGLGMQEAMLLGLPVIATGWSGNMDFMDESSAALVRYSMIPVVDDQPEYAPKKFDEPQYWADPDLDDAADKMLQLSADGELRSRIAQAGLARIRAYREDWLQSAPSVLREINQRRGSA
jgi:glycosyltransferase involved in cell wall biosynthesis